MGQDTGLQLTKIRQRFERPLLPDVPSALAQELDKVKPAIVPGAKLAVAVGSRGIAGIADVVKTTVEVVQGWGAVPFIVPAMGSHGGATAQGQVEVLASYGITEASVGAPIRSSMDTVELTAGDDLNRVYMDRYAYESDGIILINRIKPHTDFHGSYESGLVKMSVIGLGKHAQALEMHSFGVHGLRDLVPSTAARILATGKVLFGLAIVENSYDETMLLRALKAGEIMAEEPRLLEIARANMPRLPADEIDVLIVDRLGKDISGCGMDTNIIGRLMIRGEDEPSSPRIKTIVVTDVTAASHGNALGTGLADVITQRLFDKIDLPATYENIVTSAFLERGKIPVIAENDATAFAYALRGCGRIPRGTERVVRIQDTLHLAEVCVSRAVLDEIGARADVEVLGEAVDLFDTQGDLFPF
jgi:hypothetical protein